MRFYLRGCGGNQPRVNGTAIIAPTQGAIYFFDFPSNSSGQISGTLYSTRDATGTGNGDIECGGSKIAVWYGMTTFVNGKSGPEIPVHAKIGATLDVTQVTPITSNPVVTSPTGDTTYARLDGGNQPFQGNVTPNGNGTLALGSSGNRWKGFFGAVDLNTGSVTGTISGGPTWSGNHVFTGTADTFASFNSVVWVDGTKYALTAGGIQSAITAACNGTVLGSVVIPPGTISLGSTQLTIPNNCDVSGISQAATKLTLNSGAATTHFANSASSPTNIRIHDLTLDGSGSTNVSNGCVGMNAVTSPTDITIEHVTCSNTGGTGLNVTGTQANPGTRIKFLSNKILTACGVTGSGAQCYGILASFNSHLAAIDNEVGGGNVTCGICAFSTINASNATPITDVQFNSNRIHDLAHNNATGAGIDIGRATQATATGNIIYNLQQGGCIFFEAIWGGTIAANSCQVAANVLTGGPITVKTPDTTQSGEVASQDISITGNVITDNSGAATTNGGITVNGAERNITIAGNALTYLNQASNSPSAIFLQLGTSDANISASSQNFCKGITVTGNTVTNRPGTGSATIVGINLQQVVSGCVDDQIVIANNTILATNVGVQYSSTSASNGITHAGIHDNSVDTPTTALSGDGKTYTSLFAWNNNPPNSNGVQSGLLLQKFSTNAPTVNGTGFNAGTVSGSNGAATITVTVGTGTAGSTGVLNLPTAPNFWICHADNQTRADLVTMTSANATTATFTNYGTTFAATNWTNGDTINFWCEPR